MGNPFICQFVSAATIVMAGCTSIPNNPVVLDENADGSSELNVLVDERPTENRVSGHVSKSRYRAFRYGDEHFVPEPIYILDKSLLMKLGSALPNEKIKIEKFVLQEVQPINKDGAIGVGKSNITNTMYWYAIRKKKYKYDNNPSDLFPI